MKLFRLPTVGPKIGNCVNAIYEKKNPACLTHTICSQWLESNR